MAILSIFNRFRVNHRVSNFRSLDSILITEQQQQKKRKKEKKNNENWKRNKKIQMKIEEE